MDGIFQTRNILAVEAVYRPGEKKSYRQFYETGTHERGIGCMQNSE